jgi:tetratricopeptide (TPR) repeat protein
MARWRFCLVLAASLSTVALQISPARAQREDDARVFVDKATAAYGLGHYAAAAENFEKAFEARPDPALLYNAAQSHRLAGNKQRALELYESYVRMYGKKEKRTEIEARIRELKQAIERDKAVATSPPVTTEPVPAVPEARAAAAPSPPPAVASTAPEASAAPVVAPPPPPPPAAPAPVEPNAAPVLVTRPEPTPDHERSLASRPWFWVVVGVGAAVVAASAIFLATRGAGSATPTIGTVPGN